MPRVKTSIEFLYENPIGRFFMNEEGLSIWTGIRSPYKKNIITLASEDSDLDSHPLRASYVRSIPRCKLYKGLILQGYLVSPKFLRNLSSFDVRSDDLFICSYPRSGTTWTEEIVSCIASKLDANFMKKPVHDRVHHLEAGRTFRQQSFLDGLKSPRLLGTHLPLTHCPDQLQSLKCKVIYVARNPKDQAVSYYHFHRTAKYLGCKEWNWEDFLKLFNQGHLVYGSWFDHVIQWYCLSQKFPDKILFVTYEELQVNLSKKVKEIAQFLNIDLEEKTVSRIVEHCGFRHMKKNNLVNREETPLSDLFQASQFMRKGVIGDWKNHFTKEQAQQFDQLCQSRLEEVDLEFCDDVNNAINKYIMGVKKPMINTEEQTPDISNC